VPAARLSGQSNRACTGCPAFRYSNYINGLPARMTGEMWLMATWWQRRPRLRATAQPAIFEMPLQFYLRPGYGWGYPAAPEPAVKSTSHFPTAAGSPRRLRYPGILPMDWRAACCGAELAGAWEARWRLEGAAEGRGSRLGESAGVGLTLMALGWGRAVAGCMALGRRCCSGVRGPGVGRAM
jgi:hypothetical protein